MAFTIKTSKGGFKRVPEGEQELVVTDVKLVPSGKPQKVLFEYSHESGATLKESFSFTQPMQAKILGTRCDLALDGKVPEGTEIEVTDLPEMFLGKHLIAMIKHHVTDDNKTYVNIKWVESFFDEQIESEEDMSDDDDL